MNEDILSLQPGMHELCDCGLARWWHSAGSPQKCPANAGRMDWIPDSSFIGTGEVLETAAVRAQHYMNRESEDL